jgi:hypothetical protein
MSWPAPRLIEKHEDAILADWIGEQLAVASLGGPDQGG